MDRLIQAKLFGDGLCPVATPELVSRYNLCLDSLGIAPTPQTAFAIDAMGWSPTVAAEKEDLLYLSAGIANPMAVILSPDQANKPIYTPYNSYDRAMLARYFEKFKAEIADITRTTAIGLDIDQELTSYQSPLDLLLVNYIIVRSAAGELLTAGRHQQQLVARLMQEDLAWFDPALRSELAASGRRHGDLRFRRIEIPDLQFPVASFYTRAFNGAFVLRGIPDQPPLLLIEDQTQANCTAPECEVLWAGDPSLLGRLAQAGLIELNPAWYRRHPEVLDDKREALIADLLCAAEPGLDILNLTPPQKKRKLAALPAETTQLLHEFDRINKQIDLDQWTESSPLSAPLRLFLSRPHHELPADLQEVLWLLLIRLCDRDVIRLYMSDKNLFYDRYVKWPESKKAWAVTAITARYAAVQPAMA